MTEGRKAGSHRPEFLPSHPTLALLQNAMDEQRETSPTRGFHRHDPQWVSVLVERLRTRVSGKAPFIEYRRVDDFRFALAERATVALVGDWGSGNRHAVAVARQIRARQPDHVIHLGGARRSTQTVVGQTTKEQMISIWTWLLELPTELVPENPCCQ